MLSNHEWVMMPTTFNLKRLSWENIHMDFGENVKTLPWLLKMLFGSMTFSLSSSPEFSSSPLSTSAILLFMLLDGGASSSYFFCDDSFGDLSSLADFADGLSDFASASDSGLFFWIVSRWLFSLEIFMDPGFGWLLWSWMLSSLSKELNFWIFLLIAIGGSSNSFSYLADSLAFDFSVLS